MNNNKRISQRDSGLDIKIIVVGNTNTGKTSFVHRWTKNNFTDLYKATIASEFSYKLYEVNGIFHKIHLWDIAGQDKSISVTRVFCSDAHKSNCAYRHFKKIRGKGYLTVEEFNIRILQVNRR